MRLYGISGLGADQRVFEFLKLDVDLIPIHWIEPKKNEPIEEYSLRLSEGIDRSERFGILGVSFGGLVAVEISKVIKPDLTILVSSAETRSDLNPFLWILGKTGIIKVLPKQLFDPPRRIAHFLFGTDKEVLLDEIIKDTDLSFAKWAVNELLNWKNTQRLDNRILKISGTKDKLIPPSKNSPIVLLENGEHFMIVDRATEISHIINEKIKEISQVIRLE